MNSPMMSLFPNVRLSASGSQAFGEIMNVIREGKYKAEIEAIRKRLAQGDKNAADELKKNLPAFTPSGVFNNNHRAESLQHFSGVLHLDIDKLTEEQLSHMEQQLRNDHYVLAIFRSPSGLGLKVFFKTEADPAKHYHNMLRLLSHFRKKYQVEPDTSCKDLGRLCYFSCDPDAYYNPDAEVLDLGSPDDVFNGIEVELKEERGMTFTAGLRNEFVFGFALKCKGRRISLPLVIAYATKTYTQEDFLPAEITTTVQSAYRGNYSPGHRKQEKLSKYEEISQVLARHGWAFRRNIVTNQVEYCKGGHWNDVSDTVINDLVMLLAKEGTPVSDKTVTTLLWSSLSVTHDPFQSYLLELDPWDGHDYIGELWATLGADPEQEHLLRKWLVLMVASMMNPEEYQNPYILTLIGGQGAGKTRWLNRLLPHRLKNYLSQGIPDFKDKDSKITPAENLLVFIDEIDALTKAEQSRLKEMVSSKGYNVRAAYARFTEFKLRRASFCAALNHAQFLFDLTGSRRFFCIEIPGSINHHHQVDLDGVFAQALALFQSREPLYLTNEEDEALNAHNQQYQAYNLSEELLDKYIKKPEEGDETVRMSATEVGIYIAGQEGNLQLEQRHFRDIGILLSKKGFEKVKVNGGYKYVVALIAKNRGGGIV